MVEEGRAGVVTGMAWRERAGGTRRVSLHSHSHGGVHGVRPWKVAVGDVIEVESLGIRWREVPRARGARRTGKRRHEMAVLVSSGSSGHGGGHGEHSARARRARAKGEASEGVKARVKAAAMVSR